MGNISAKCFARCKIHHLPLPYFIFWYIILQFTPNDFVESCLLIKSLCLLILSQRNFFMHMKTLLFHLIHYCFCLFTFAEWRKKWAAIEVVIHAKQIQCIYRISIFVAIFIGSSFFYLPFHYAFYYYYYYRRFLCMWTARIWEDVRWTTSIDEKIYKINIK